MFVLGNELLEGCIAVASHDFSAAYATELSLQKGCNVEIGENKLVIDIHKVLIFFMILIYFSDSAKDPRWSRYWILPIRQCLMK